MESISIDKVKQAFTVANNAIYFADRSDYLTALHEVCECLNLDAEYKEMGSKYIEEDPNEKCQEIIYEYLVIYEMPNARGRCKVDRTKLLDSFKDLEELEIYLRSSESVALGVPRDVKEKLLVMDFKLLRKKYK